MARAVKSALRFLPACAIIEKKQQKREGGITLKIVTMDVLALEDDEVFARFYAQLSPFRQEKLNRYRFRKDQLLSLGAGVLLDLLLQDLGLREHDMEYSLGENEKPFFSNAPELQFNLSHSDTQVLAALSDRLSAPKKGDSPEALNGEYLRLAQELQSLRSGTK